jgi:hypothetical protein
MISRTSPRLNQLRMTDQSMTASEQSDSAHSLQARARAHTLDDEDAVLPRAV